MEYVLAAAGFAAWSFGAYSLGVYHGIRIEQKEQFQAREALGVSGSANYVPRGPR